MLTETQGSRRTCPWPDQGMQDLNAHLSDSKSKGSGAATLYTTSPNNKLSNTSTFKVYFGSNSCGKKPASHCYSISIVLKIRNSNHQLRQSHMGKASIGTSSFSKINTGKPQGKHTQHHPQVCPLLFQITTGTQRCPRLCGLFGAS